MRKFVLLIGSLASSAFAGTNSYVPSAGLVPNESTAVAIAVAVWKPIYGDRQIEGQRPIVATLRGDVWYVTGTLPKDTAGGTATAEISKKDGQILRISHGR